MPSERDKAFCRAVRRFKFNAVRCAMEAAEWKWGYGEDARYPDEWEMVARCFELWLIVRNAPAPCRTGSGGFLVGISEDDPPCAFVEFAIEETEQIEEGK